jgi:hypothetical protein
VTEALRDFDFTLDLIDDSDPWDREVTRRRQ